MPKVTDEFSAKEAQQRFEAALRGARITGHKPMSDMKVGKKQRPAKASPRPLSSRKKPKKRS